jgi:hypothetical protein
MFRAPYPYYFDRHDLVLARLDSLTPKIAMILRDLGLLATQRHTAMVVEALMQEAELAPQRQADRMSYMSKDAIYLRRSETSMIKITADRIEEVPLGTDNVVLLGDDLGDWPSVAELQPHIDELRPRIGRACTRLVPGLPMTEILTTRWSKVSIFSPEQAHHMLIARFMFTAVASRYSLWPLLMITGPQNSGKSTPFECFLTLLKGRKMEAEALPKKEGDLLASATNRSFLVYDNIDEVRAADYDNTLCHLATGAEVDLRVLFRTNSLVSYQLRNHAVFTARVNPFSRSDVMRRMIVLEVKASHGAATTVTKDKLLARVLKYRSELLAEYILRAQNILAAHIIAGDRDYNYQSEMAEYEAFMLRCAEYEGSLPETWTLWSHLMRQYDQAVSSSNPMVYAIRLWLGKEGNPGRVISPAALFAELRSLHCDIGQEFFLKSPSSFGKNIGKHESSLHVLGFSRVPTRAGHDYLFDPAPQQLETCKALLKDLKQNGV